MCALKIILYCCDDPCDVSLHHMLPEDLQNVCPITVVSNSVLKSSLFTAKWMVNRVTEHGDFSGAEYKRDGITAGF